MDPVEPSSTSPDWSDEHLLRAPHSGYQRLLADAPVSWSSALQAWVVVSDRLVRDLLVDARLSAQGPMAFMAMLPPEESARLAELREFYGHWMVFSDPPLHTSLRGRVLPDWSPSRTACHRPLVEAMVADAVRPLVGRECDAVEELARPLANAIICAILRIPASDAALVAGWAADIIRFIVTPRPLVELGHAALASVRELRGYALERVAEADHPLHAVLDLGPTAVTATFAQFLTGGSDPLSAALAGTIDAMAGFPEQWRRVGGTGEVTVAGAVAEILRYTCPFTLAPRIALAEIEVGGQRIAAGSSVLLLLSAANRDGARFPQVDDLSLGHPSSGQHLTFGRGAHYCLGANLTRLVLEEFVAHLTGSVEVERTGPAQWLPAFGLRSPAVLPVRLRARTRPADPGRPPLVPAPRTPTGLPGSVGRIAAPGGPCLRPTEDPEPGGFV
ncbi:cytochrome P450 [Micromonospora maritima]|uniref:cytochrome P450 n=1 Tax=Micromonospora maritima TaxID=986711 RepID=UPI0037A8207D